jgi:hypothetical protein
LRPAHLNDCSWFQDLAIVERNAVQQLLIVGRGGDESGAAILVCFLDEKGELNEVCVFNFSVWVLGEHPLIHASGTHCSSCEVGLDVGSLVEMESGGCHVEGCTDNSLDIFFEGDVAVNAASRNSVPAHACSVLIRCSRFEEERIEDFFLAFSVLCRSVG